MIKIKYVILASIIIVFMMIFTTIYTVEKQKVNALRAQVRKQLSHINQLKSKIKQLENELVYYRSVEAIKEEAHKNFFLVEPNEEIFKIVPIEKKKK